MRVLAPAARAWRTEYDGSIARVDIPFADDPAADVSYPLPAQRAADYFFQVPSERRPWIAAVQADGRGLVQTSTAQLRGRKLFCWGTAAGGRHWQEWLCGPGSRYLEIQAGLATTQLEHLRLEAKAEISWAEAYAPIEAAPGRYTVLGRTRSPRSLSCWPERFPTRSSTNGTAGGEPRWPIGRRSRWRPALALARLNLSLRGRGSRQSARHPVRTAALRRLRPSRRPGSHGRGRPGRCGCRCLGAPDHGSLGTGTRPRSERLVGPTHDRYSGPRSRRP